MTDATAGYPIVLQLDDGTEANFTTIAEVKDISGPSFALDTPEATNHDSPNGWEEVIGTILRGGTVTFPVNWLPTNATQDGNTGLMYLMLTRTRRLFKLVFSDAGPSFIIFPAIVNGFNFDSPVAGISGANISLKVTGEPSGDGTWLPA